jgi:RimJ/RimL family protein N-acetyltransferase
MIRLLKPALPDLRRIREAGRLESCRGHAAAAPDVLPGVIVEDSIGRFEAGEEWFWCAPRLLLDEASDLIVGSACFRHAPREGAVEIGYGVASAFEGRGIATKGAALMVEEAFARPEVTAVTAETSTANRGSERVLEKNGFLKIGSRVDPEDGPVTRWRLDRPSPQA